MDHVSVINEYLEKISTKYYSGDATEHSYRSSLENLIEAILPTITALNERKRVSVGAPDLVLFRKPENPSQLELIRNIPLGFVEAKDIQPEILDRKENQEQIARYMELGNVVHTDGLEFRFYFEKKLVKKVVVATLEQGRITPQPSGYDDLIYYFQQTISTAGRTIRTAKTLALQMADKARPIRRTILSALEQDIESNEMTDLRAQYDAFRETLIHDLSAQDFSDIYAETIAYGLFAARYNDDSPETFSLSEAAEKVPQTNPFLRQFFLQIAAYEKDTRLDWVLNNFADLFSYTDVHKIMSTYGRTTGTNHDPVTHFYETFLGEYDPKRRKARGVYYTPLPVVQYIVNAVDTVLKTEFDLPDGLADDSTITQTVRVEGYKKGKGTGKVHHRDEVEIPRVQILDPATGTGTFLNETIKLIAKRKQHLGSGWNSYVEDNLLPRIHGFEILMAAYSMAHMRLGLTLAETGYVPSAQHPRIGVYLTNSLEEPAKDEPPLLAMLGMGRALTEEAIAADKVKRDLPIMVVMGNPPYSVSSSNKGKFIQALIADYKKDLNEKKINLDDDYIKFIRYAEHMIEKAGQGVVAMITNNSFIDGITHRQMRKQLLETFDKIHVLDLHGNSKKKETTPNGGKDENVFDIQAGVSIIILVKKTKSELNKSEANFAEIYGKRSEKYQALETKHEFNRLEPAAPNFFFVPRDEVHQSYIANFISIRDLFPNGTSGFRCGDDDAQICWNDNQIQAVVQDLIDLPEEAYRIKYNLKDGRNHNYVGMRADVNGVVERDRIIKLLYRPFDIRSTYYSKKSSSFAARPRNSTMDHFVLKSNIALISTRQSGAANLYYFDCAWVGENVVDENFVRRGSSQVFPLYLYNPDGSRIANFNSSLLKTLTHNLMGSYQAQDIFDYIYGILHNPTYREKYKEFLKIDFPRIPPPKDDAEFAHFRSGGEKLRELHLMHNITPHNSPLEGEGSGEVEKLRYENERVYINSSQYFANVPKVAWNFYIGGYQPAQKWLKDRVIGKLNRPLNYKDIEHYQKIITILVETDKIMKQIAVR